eukprot:1136334-Pelagomonas_calceolata.AAC.1
MEPSGKRHWRVKDKDQRTRKHTLIGESRPGGCTFKKSMLFLYLNRKGKERDTRLYLPTRAA